ncbi:MAG: YHS domain-containing protein [Rhodanobacter sp.]|nr:MAG: YHS domain-containing protein [Rhodanobacter sp.]TAL91447.1 MAG: YHS domain-containing protein [Rhodanobacter sp.]TAM42150.1 MAG: YHS domain-containing protein [Rhodanobacter sp.]TAN26751.1 MAG: YHS domain-containing protein [Rhodanobacter sp.]
MKNHIVEHVIKDPVCGMEISRKSACEEFTYLDKTYYFCSETCLTTFQDEPGKYINQHRQHGINPK